MGRYNLLVFDWDGTVVDTVQHIVGAMESAIAATGLPARTREQILGIIGLGMHEAASTLFPDKDRDMHSRMVGHYSDNYLTATAGKTMLFPGVRDTLERLHARGYLLAVATGKSRRGLERAFADTGIRSLFHVTRCADETFSKPHPRMLLEIMQTLDVEPDRTLMIGDSLHDLQMARNAGVDSVAVTYGAQPLHSLLELQPATQLDTLGDLPAWLDSQSLETQVS